MEFSDGDKVRSSGDHLWKVARNKTNKNKICKLSELTNDLLAGKKEKRVKWKIELPQSLRYETKEVLITPYIMGLLLGDGRFRSGVHYTSIDEQLLEDLPEKYKFRNCCGSKITSF